MEPELRWFQLDMDHKWEKVKTLLDKWVVMRSNVESWMRSNGVYPFCKPDLYTLGSKCPLAWSLLDWDQVPQKLPNNHQHDVAYSSAYVAPLSPSPTFPLIFISIIKTCDSSSDKWLSQYTWPTQLSQHLQHHLVILLCNGIQPFSQGMLTE